MSGRFEVILHSKTYFALFAGATKSDALVPAIGTTILKLYHAPAVTAKFAESEVVHPVGVPLLTAYPEKFVDVVLLY